MSTDIRMSSFRLEQRHLADPQEYTWNIFRNAIIIDGPMVWAATMQGLQFMHPHGLIFNVPMFLRVLSEMNDVCSEYRNSQKTIVLQKYNKETVPEKAKRMQTERAMNYFMQIVTDNVDDVPPLPVLLQAVRRFSETSVIMAVMSDKYSHELKFWSKTQWAWSTMGLWENSAEGFKRLRIDLHRKSLEIYQTMKEDKNYKASFKKAIKLATIGVLDSDDDEEEEEQ
ncbi:hypothetical protein EDD22DRAFT_961866 [Suillus occidentalis]|nr:hypothetical protein EDD22DRAFT_961866 [Suillus occidentalis]